MLDLDLKSVKSMSYTLSKFPAKLSKLVNLPTSGAPRTIKGVEFSWLKCFDNFLSMSLLKYIVNSFLSVFLM